MEPRSQSETCRDVDSDDHCGTLASFCSFHHKTVSIYSQSCRPEIYMDVWWVLGGIFAPFRELICIIVYTSLRFFYVHLFTFWDHLFRGSGDGGDAMGWWLLRLLISFRKLFWVIWNRNVFELLFEGLKSGDAQVHSRTAIPRFKIWCRTAAIDKFANGAT